VVRVWPVEHQLEFAFVEVGGDGRELLRKVLFQS
jgi:hypothetical protein